TRAALKIVREESWRRDKLHSLVQQFRQGAKQLGLRVSDFETPIQPLLLQEPERALAASEALLEHGIYVTAIRPPTVPEGTSRLRVTFSAAHETRHVEKLLAALDACRVANLCS
ncbi:MAG: aminotransferase class I/II-fold pyridoxal phosphate-dependent enzyme, partial [Gammaproteobacteria bacterium]